jgi:sugar lactone lactonase YvrE
MISHGTSALMQANLQHVVCEGVPVLAQFRETGKKVEGPAASYLVKDFCHGNQIADLGAKPEIKTTLDAVALKDAPAPAATDIPALPPQNTWVNIAKLGAKGDGTTDDTAVFRKAIEEHQAIYLPQGRYKITEPLVLKSDTVLIGLNPTTTQIDVPDFTAPFQGEGGPLPVIEAPKAGTNIITGIGIDTGVNNRAVGLKWAAGEKSYVNDVRFLGGHGTYGPDGQGIPVYNSSRGGDPDQRKRWDSQFWSLWITDGGGGTFKDIWTPDTFAQAGIYVSDTQTPGRLYAMSIEHHVRNEVKFRNVSNWVVYDMQMEEERGEGPKAQPLDIEGCSHLAFVNLYLYRVNSPGAFPCGVRIRDSKDLDFRNVHCYGPGKLNHDNTLYDQTHDIEVRTREIARLTVSGKAPKGGLLSEALPFGWAGSLSATADWPAAFQERPELDIGTKVAGPVLNKMLRDAAGTPMKMADGFENIDSTVADADGNLYFIDTPTGRVWKYSPEKNNASLVTDAPIRPQALAVDKAGNLMVVARAMPSMTGTGGPRQWGPPIPVVYAFKPGAKDGEFTVLKATTAAAPTGATPILPQTRWRDAHDFMKVCATPAKTQFLSPDGSAFIPSSDDLLRAYALAPAPADKPFYVADEFGQRVFSFTVKPDGTLVDPKLICEEGEAGVAVDADGNVYVAAGHIFVYDKAGKLIDVIACPERPSCLTFGGKDRQTLYIAARTTLYAVRTKVKGL